MTVLATLLVIAVLVLCWVLKTLWGSKLFWVAAFALTIILFPLTAGMSPIVLFLLIVLRLVLINRAFTAGGVK